MENDITSTDKILMDLNLIKEIFETQYLNNRYANRIEIRSKRDLFDNQSIKREFTDRYESTQNLTPLIRQLNVIRGKAVKVLRSYKMLVSNIHKKFITEYNTIRNTPEEEKFIKHHSLLFIADDDSSLRQVLFGYTHKCLSIYKRYRLRKKYNELITCNNSQLEVFCQDLINFIDDFIEPNNILADELKTVHETSRYRIAKGKKTDFAKIISAMYDCRLFETDEGKIASNKQDLMNTFGKLFSEDFSNYSTLINRAKETAVYCEIFDKLKEKAEEYEKKSV